MDWVKVLLTILRSASKIAIGAIIRARNNSVEMGRLVVWKPHPACPIAHPSQMQVKNEKAWLPLATTPA